MSDQPEVDVPAILQLLNHAADLREKGRELFPPTEDLSSHLIVNGYEYTVIAKAFSAYGVPIPPWVIASPPISPDG